MSVLDDLRTAEQRVAERLRELKPSVDEYRELQEVAKRLGIDPDAATTPTATKRPSRRRSASRPARANRVAKATSTKAKSATPTRSANGQRSQQLAELVRARPGITVREAGEELGVDPTSLYRVVHRLEQSGELRKNGRSLEPATSD